MKYFLASKIYFFYLFGVFLLFFYSYTQIDLGLTLTKITIWQSIQHSFQYIGYFQRPLSTALFTFIVLFFFVFYLIFINLAKQGKLSLKKIWILIIVQTLILTFSYNAFSYDIFNYIFDARIVTFYHLNPYLHAALDFPGDPMLHFMHWTQRTFPYGPAWLGITLPFSWLGFQYFLPTFFLFKALISSFYLLSCYFLSKAIKIISPKQAVFGLVLFALNPLVVIESLVSAHNEIVSVGLSLIAMYFILNNKNIHSIIVYIISVLIKYTSLFLLPLYIIVFLFNNRKLQWQMVFDLCLPFMILAIVLESLRTNFQPWYLVSALVLVPLGSKKSYILIPSFIFSMTSLFQYIPFLYTGNWDPPIPTILNLMLLFAGAISGVLVLLQKSKKMLQ